MGLLFGVSSSSTACTFTLFFCSTLITFGFNIMWPRAIRSRHNIGWYSQDSARYCWVFVKRNFVCESKFSWWLFSIGCSVSFCLKTLPLNTPLFEETVFEKSQVFNLSRFKIGNCVWWCFVRVRTFEITEWIVCSVLLESTVISFDVNRGIKVFPGKVINL